jgi:periplasmic copper chaperone A
MFFQRFMSKPLHWPPGRGLPFVGLPFVGLLLAGALTTAGCADDGAPAATPAGLDISDARVRALIPGQDKTAGYFTAHNPTTDSIVLTGARSGAVRAIEMHISIRDGDMMRMRRLEQVEIAPEETVRFEPGGRHLMLFGVEALNSEVTITLEQHDGTLIPVRFAIIPTGGG